MFKKQGEKAQPEVVETACPVHGSRSEPAMLVHPTPESPDLEPRKSKQSAKGAGRNMFEPNIFRDPLFWVALIISVSVISAFQWLRVGRMDDLAKQSDNTWQEYVAGLSTSDANVMEWRLNLDELKQKHVGVWPDPPIHSELRAKVWRGKFYAYRNRDAEAVKTLQAAFDFWQANKGKVGQENPKTWELLCRLHNNNHDYAKTVRIFDKLVAEDSSLRKAHRQYADIQRTVLQAYEALGNKKKADMLKAAIQKSSRTPARADNWEQGKDTKEAFGDMRFREYDYALSLLYEGKSKEAAARLRSIVRDDKAWREHSDNAQFRAKLIMMLAVANVAAANWDEAEKIFPAALRLAEQQKFCPNCCNTKPTLYRAYAMFLLHQGKSDEAARYEQMGKAAQAEPMGSPGSDDPSEKNVFAKSDLYQPYLKSD